MEEKTQAITGLQPEPDWPARFEPEQVSSSSLAPYLWPLLLNPRCDKPYLSGLKNRLFDLTVRMAFKYTSWYAKTLREPKEPITATTFETLPMVSRSQIAEYRDDFIANITTFGFATFTSGSTMQSPLMIERAVEEQQYLVNLLSGITPHNSGLKPLGLVSGNGSHGEVFQVPGRGYAFSINFEQEASFRKAAWLLQQKFNLPNYERKISFIQGYFEYIHLLVLYLKQCGIELEQDQIRSVACFGMPIPPSRRSEVAEYFSTQVEDNYSLGEVNGSARYDSRDDSYAFSPMVHAEVVDLISGRPIERGSGELVVTTLFPFTQRFPLIRYRTGDVVFTPGRSLPSVPLFRVRGRLLESIELPGSHLLCRGDIALALEDLPFVVRTEGLSMVVKDSCQAAGPKFKLTPTKKGGALLQIEVIDKTDDGLQNQSNMYIEQIRSSILNVLPTDTCQILIKNPKLLEIKLFPFRYI